MLFSLESPHRGDSNENNTIYHFQYKKENYPKLSKIYNFGIFSKGLKNEFETTTVVNEPSVFEPLKVYCTLLLLPDLLLTRGQLRATISKVKEMAVLHKSRKNVVSILYLRRN